MTRTEHEAHLARLNRAHEEALEERPAKKRKPAETRAIKAVARRLARGWMEAAFSAESVGVDYDARVEVEPGGSAWVTVRVFVPSADIEEEAEPDEDHSACEFPCGLVACGRDGDTQ